MALRRRLTRLEARKPRAPGPVRILRLVLAPGDEGPVLEGAMWRDRDGWREMARDPCESPRRLHGPRLGGSGRGGAG